MKKIIGYNGKTLEELKIIFHCTKCGCDFEAEYGDYDECHESAYSHSSYCPKCNRKVYAIRRD
jgi:hypothetical protein